MLQPKYQKGDLIKVMLEGVVAQNVQVPDGTVLWGRVVDVIVINDITYEVDLGSYGMVFIDSRKVLEGESTFKPQPESPRFEFRRQDMNAMVSLYRGGEFPFLVACRNCGDHVVLKMDYADPEMSKVHHRNTQSCSKWFPEMRFAELRQKSEAELRQYFVTKLLPEDVIIEGNEIVEIAEDGVRYTSLRPATPAQLLAKNARLLEHRRQKLAEKSR